MMFQKRLKILLKTATALASYARREGLGASVAGGPTAGEVAAALGTALMLAAVGGWAGLLALVLAMAASGGFLLYMVRRVGGYTGDGLGAMAQLGEIAVMLTLAGAWA